MSEKIDIKDFVFCISCNIFYFKNLKMCPFCEFKNKVHSSHNSDRKGYGSRDHTFSTEAHGDKY
ncbi:TPA: hypothetical protein DCZ46_03655 [Candidatus Campbellbacteria bacterium]|nr:MAG: hypothetical protein UR58_C0001G0703 [Candidatus Campbellbacteria bacterium GW2011_OD1_34_28]KKP74773.1 MAG: hypothetical protein UR74_C0002G0039 [Candidatus Campbellbacteria bacterium GW2011_GWD2_35_24]KKP75659.1 MAG: hypothetical protein UR75_C0002G0040 [Candidatus Campbellbacteria bacterium GW2011_GWC2_35_28]KKP77093.1 MAG: hypothetical protein UR76_C0002G0294 [Candidatus Campbellbacteria bacterium GW2011_GWC1_35_31]KKP79019.1 MAG: hypothetical protein UR79_C0002G0294 [Candidatus Cam